MDITFMVALVIALALFFDFTNGFHDTANAMATPIATGAIKPKTAVTLAALLNLVGAFLSTEVAKTVSGGIIREGTDGVQITPEIIFAGLMGAILWNMITWLKGLPSSSSHALFGGLIGAAIAGIGFGSVNLETLLQKVILPAIFAPLIAGLVAYVCTRLAYALTSRHDPETGSKLTQKRGGFRTGQIFTSSLVALAHGTNDAQKTMGIITLVLIAAGTQAPGTGPQFWVIAACALAIAIGTYSGGWRIIRTMGSGLTEVKPAQGFAAETSTASAILASSHLGFALSTTQVASGSVIGSGMGRKGTTVRWNMVGKIAIGWLFTLPAAGIVGALTALLVNTGVVGVLIAAIAGTGAVLFMFFYSRKSAVGHHNAVEVEEAGQAVRFAKKKAMARARAEAKAKAKAEASTKANATPQAEPESQTQAPADADATNSKETQR
ncbi:PiT family inorganic phosphate transporter [Arthrobacter sp. SORGH_AS 212]|uniref:inorganic phosphate transporter n=1 Tax=Pseudarthrobacter TaxID=1742993 RepID=UPI0021C4DB2C|nr:MULTISPECIES: anion permease [Pseudarthrobacter]MCT9625399.1 inorganic phosphate transporter [Pseudarthrobacter equi]MDQ1056092.1 PiT family inorganic phosphate transporter [Arthrobacter sp. SORGH_AS_0212]